ncbi:MAG TPA: class II glutamine amidotransferase [Candidatus Dormibacteraeota bacterium]
MAGVAMCEVLVAVWPEPQPFSRVLPWGLKLERLGIGGFGWGLAWREGDGIRRHRNPGPLSRDHKGQAELAEVSSTHFLLHLRRPSKLSTVAMADTQPFVSDDGSFSFAHNGRLALADQLRDRFPGRLFGRADSEVGFRLFAELLGGGMEGGAALAEVHRQMGGNANLAYLPARGQALFYAGNPQNDVWCFRLDGAECASTALHSADQALFDLCFPAATDRVRLAPTQVTSLGEGTRAHLEDGAVAVGGGREGVELQ